jgi:hypothetical protein
MPYTTDAIIVLYVNTANIINYNNSQTTEVKNCVYLGDNQGDIDPADKSNFTTYLSGNSQIAWVGAVQNITPGLTDYVLISSITFKTDQNNIGITLRPKQNGSGDTHIDGFFTGNKTSGTFTNYTINFSVFRGGQEYTYSIDPQLKMR